MSNIAALSRFVEANKLKKDAHGRGSCSGLVVLKSANRTWSEILVVRFSFNNSFGDQLVLEETGEFAAGAVPIGFKTEFGTWECVANDLTIRGDYPGLGPYTLSISAD